MRAPSAYRWTAYILLNSLLLLVLINGLATGVLVLYHTVHALHPAPWHSEPARGLKRGPHPGFSDEEIGAMTKELWQPFAYEPFALIKEQPRTGRFVNVSPQGFRKVKDQAPWPLAKDAYTIFVFGGSTTFGYGVTDAQTVPSFLQEALRSGGLKRANVYNFGRGFYYSSTERILFSNLLVAGERPNMVLFIDGLNDAYYVKDEPAFSDAFRDYMDSSPAQARDLLKQLFWKLPAARLIRGAIDLFQQGNEPLPEIPQPLAGPKTYGKPNVLSSIIQRYNVNKRLIEASCRAFGITSVFVWQAVPTYKYDLQHDLYASTIPEEHYQSQFLYPAMAAYAAAHDMGSDFIWAADGFRNIGGRRSAL